MIDGTSNVPPASFVFPSLIPRLLRAAASSGKTRSIADYKGIVNKYVFFFNAKVCSAE